MTGVLLPMLHIEDKFYGSCNTILYMQGWLPEGKPSASVVLVHGIGEHSGRYAVLASAMAQKGLAVYGFDQRGHGQSEGRRGHVGRWTEYLDDLGLFLGRIKMPGIPLFVMGHSMGALVVLDYLIQRSTSGLAGAIISAPPLQPAGVARPYLVLAARILSCLWPVFLLRLGLKAEDLSRDSDVEGDYRRDPLVFGKVTARWGSEILSAISRVRKESCLISIPLMMIHGEEDRINLPAGTRELAERTGSADKTVIIYPGTYHEPHNDLNHAAVAADIGAWLERHIGLGSLPA